MMAGGGLTGDAAILSDDVRRFKEESEKEVMEVSTPVLYSWEPSDIVHHCCMSGRVHHVSTRLRGWQPQASQDR